MLWTECCCIPLSYAVLSIGPLFVFSKPTRDSTSTLKMLFQNPSCAFLTDLTIFLMKTVLMLNWVCIILWLPPCSSGCGIHGECYEALGWMALLTYKNPCVVNDVHSLNFRILMKAVFM